MGLATSICVGHAFLEPFVFGAGAVEADSVVPEPEEMVFAPGRSMRTTSTDLIFMFVAFLGNVRTPPYHPKSASSNSYIRFILRSFYRLPQFFPVTSPPGMKD